MSTSVLLLYEYNQLGKKIQTRRQLASIGEIKLNTSNNTYKLPTKSWTD